MRIMNGHLRFSSKEIWNLGEHIATCIYDGILQFKNAERKSYPGDISSKTWEEYLDKMLFSFKEISTFYKNDPLEIYFSKMWDSGERDLKKSKHLLRFAKNLKSIMKILKKDWIYSQSII